MTTKELLHYHEFMCNTARETMEQKNHDYSGASGTTPFANFEVTEKLGLAKTESGMLIRMVDKIQRLITHANSGELKVADEPVEQACLDLINYSILLSAFVKDQQQKNL